MLKNLTVKLFIVMFVSNKEILIFKLVTFDGKKILFQILFEFSDYFDGFFAKCNFLLEHNRIFYYSWRIFEERKWETEKANDILQRISQNNFFIWENHNQVFDVAIVLVWMKTSCRLFLQRTSLITNKLSRFRTTITNITIIISYNRVWL